MCDKAVDTYPSTIKFVPKCSKTKEMCHRAVHGCSFVFDVILDKYKIQELWNLVVSLYIPFIVYFPNKYITQEICDEAANDSEASLKLISDWFVTSKMIKNLSAALYADENLLCFNEDSVDAVCHYNKMVIVNSDLNNTSLDDNSNEEDPITVILIRHFA